MGNHDIETTARELQELKRMKEELESEITSLEDQIKAEMTVRNTDDLTAGVYRIKWTTYQSSRFDSTRFKGTVNSYAQIRSQASVKSAVRQ